MDKDQEEMQFLGVFGIYAEACKLIFRCRIFFAQITVALILPLSVVLLIEDKVRQILFLRIMRDEDSLMRQDGTPSNISLDRAAYFLFKTAYYTSVLLFSLLSTAAAVYTVASIHTSRETSFKKVMTVVPKVWKRLVLTFLFTYVIFFVYNMVFTVITHLVDYITRDSDVVNTVVTVIMLILYCTGFIYMTINWLLASVVSVLEDSYGFKALVKSKNLIKGKMRVATSIFFIFIVFYFAVYYVFVIGAMYTWKGDGILQRVVLGVLCVFLMSMLILFSLVVQTIIYFVCKAYHHESIDKSALSDHLDVYMGDYVPLKAKDIQLEECS